MKRFFISVLIVMITTFFLSDYIYGRYQDNYEEDKTFYYLQQGVYTDKRSVQDVSASYITVFEEDKYYNYLGMTTKVELAEQIKKMYEAKGIFVYIKKSSTEHQEFLNELSQYDILLENAESDEERENILETILATFQETVLENES